MRPVSVCACAFANLGSAPLDDIPGLIREVALLVCANLRGGFILGAGRRGGDQDEARQENSDDSIDHGDLF
ncbi:MAG: hypothetical protein ACJAYU_001497 [Bradymonadia bacterium]